MNEEITELREKHDISVDCIPSVTTLGEVDFRIIHKDGLIVEGPYETQEQAIKEGLKVALKLIE